MVLDEGAYEPHGDPLFLEQRPSATLFRCARCGARAMGLGFEPARLEVINKGPPSPSEKSCRMPGEARDRAVQEGRHHCERKKGARALKSGFRFFMGPLTYYMHPHVTCQVTHIVQSRHPYHSTRSLTCAPASSSTSKSSVLHHASCHLFLAFSGRPSQWHDPNHRRGGPRTCGADCAMRGRLARASRTRLRLSVQL